MRVSVLERLLHAERHRRRVSATLGGFVPPVATSFASEPDQAPWVTSLSTGKFAPTGIKEGFVTQVFSECPTEEEGRLLTELYQTLRTLRSVFRWGNYCSTIAEAKARMVRGGLEPQTLVVPYDTLSEVAGQDLSEKEVEMLMMTKGCVADVEGVKILSAGQALPKGSAILGANPALVGHYTRIYDYVAATVLQADRTLVLVGDEVA